MLGFGRGLLLLTTVGFCCWFKRTRQLWRRETEERRRHSRGVPIAVAMEVMGNVMGSDSDLAPQQQAPDYEIPTSSRSGIAPTEYSIEENPYSEVVYNATVETGV